MRLLLPNPVALYLVLLASMAISKKQACPSSAEWPDRAVSILLKTYAQKFSVDRGYLRTQDWQEVAHAVNSVCNHIKTLKQCRDKVDSLKRRYKMEKRKAVTGSEVCWPFFHRLDDIMHSVLKQGKGHYPKHPNASSTHGSPDTEDEDDYENFDNVEEFREEVEEEDMERLQEAAHESKDEEVDADEGAKDAEDEKFAASVSLSASSDSPPYLTNGKASGHAEDIYGMSDEDDALNGHSYRQMHLPYGHDKHHSIGHNPQGLHFLHAHHYPAEHAYHEHAFLQRAPSRLYSFSGGTHESTQNSSQAKDDRSRSRAHKRKIECDNGIDALANAVTGLSKAGTSTCFSDVLARIELAKVKILKKVKLEMAKLDRKQDRTCTSTKLQPSMSTGS